MPCWRPARCRAPRGSRWRWAWWRSASTCSTPAIAAAAAGRCARSRSISLLPLAILALTYWLAGRQTPIAVNIALSLLIVAAIGLYLYRIAFQPIAHTSVLVLLIASVGCHLALQGLGLVFFGAEGLRGPALSNAAFTVGPLRFTGQSLAVYGITVAFIVALWLFFGYHALRQGAARHRRQPARRAPRRHPHLAVGTDRLPAGVRDRRDFRHPDRADHDALLRHRLPDRPEGFRRRDHRRPGQLSADRGRGPGGRHASRRSPRSMPATTRRSSSSR